eukprot:2082150-Amphidinium_carterae.1
MRWLVARRLGDHAPVKRASTTITPEAEEELAEAIAADELADMLAAVRRPKIAVPKSGPPLHEDDPTAVGCAGVAPATYVEGAAAASSSSTAPGPCQSRLIDARPRDGAAFTLEDARLLLPRAKGCGVAIHSNKAWQVKYTERSTPGPKSRMGTYSGRDGLSFNTALK